MSTYPRCARCGAVIESGRHRKSCRACASGSSPAHDATAALLSKLTQLTRFGLAAEDPPLLVREE